jgi:outer membrane protein OmpA-like peptidoglycan-associated protein
VGNAGLARQIGGRFNVAAGRYPKGEGQPLLIKLINRATLTVGINSTESLLYKRLAHPSLPRPADIPIDRLSFDLGQARLGAEGAQQLGSIASLLKTFPKARLVVVGHANNHEAQAMRLGLQRANLAVEELVKQGIPPDRLQAQGMLSTELPSDNDSAEKQASLQGITLKISRL